MSRHYPAIARRFPELSDLQEIPTSEADATRTEAYKSLYGKLTVQERVIADRKIAELRVMMGNTRLGEQGAWELLVALGQAMEWLDWPER